MTEVASASTRKLTRIFRRPCGGIPATDENGERLVIYMGIIDILQDYGIKKITEHCLKSLCIRSADIVSSRTCSDA